MPRPTDASTAPVPPILNYETGGDLLRRRYTVGTLVYTSSGLALLFFWLLWGDFALSLRDRSVGPLIEKFLLLQGASNTLKQALKETLPLVIALVLSPIVSYKSDRLRSRWGRRIPFLLIPTPIAALAMVGIAFSPQMGQALFHATGNTVGAGQTIEAAAFNYTIGLFTILWIIFEVAVIISASVLGGLINDVVPRPMLGRFYGLFRMVSLGDGIIFNWFLFKHAEKHFTLMFAVIGIIFGIGFVMMCLKVKEGAYPPPAASDDPRAKGFIAGVRIYFRECFTRPYYLLVFAMFTMGAMTFRPINDFSIRYAAQLGVPDDLYGKLVGGSYMISLVLAFPLGVLVDKFGALRMGLAALSLYFASTLYGAVFITGQTSFGIALVAHTVLSGTYFTCSASFGQLLLPRSKFLTYASAGGMITSLSSIVLAQALGILLDVTMNNYRLTFVIGLALSATTITLMLYVQRRFNDYGGRDGYIAPGEDDDPSANRGFEVVTSGRH